MNAKPALDARKPEMDKRTLVALKGSIAKWEQIVAGTAADMAIENCPLCAEFIYNRDSDGVTCFGCPVRARVNVPGCNGTPYVEWCKAHRGRKEYAPSDFSQPSWLGHRNETDADKVLAQAELDFLRSLLPQGAGSI